MKASENRDIRSPRNIREALLCDDSNPDERRTLGREAQRQVLEAFWPQIVQYTVETAVSKTSLRVDLFALLEEAEECGFSPPR